MYNGQVSILHGIKHQKSYQDTQSENYTCCNELDSNQWRNILPRGHYLSSRKIIFYFRQTSPYKV